MCRTFAKWGLSYIISPDQRCQGGYSLVELILVMALLVLIAAAAITAFDSNDDAVLDRAAAEVASAIRFAQAEAIRTGRPFGVIANPFNDTLRVYRLDDSVNPPVVVYDVFNPFTKQPYDLDVSAGASDVDISIVYFKFDGLFFPTTYVGFAKETGVPKYNDSGTNRMLENGYLQLRLHSETRTIAVSPVTGRVTVQ